MNVKEFYYSKILKLSFDNPIREEWINFINEVYLHLHGETYAQTWSYMAASTATLNMDKVFEYLQDIWNNKSNAVSDEEISELVKCIQDVVSGCDPYIIKFKAGEP